MPIIDVLDFSFPNTQELCKSLLLSYKSWHYYSYSFNIRNYLLCIISLRYFVYLNFHCSSRVALVFIVQRDIACFICDVTKLHRPLMHSSFTLCFLAMWSLYSTEVTQTKKIPYTRRVYRLSVHRFSVSKINKSSTLFSFAF